jgi:hypothetical protein
MHLIMDRGVSYLQQVNEQTMTSGYRNRLFLDYIQWSRNYYRNHHKTVINCLPVVVHTRNGTQRRHVYRGAAGPRVLYPRTPAHLRHSSRARE